MFFKAKDLMTAGNIAAGLGAVLVAMEGMKAGTKAEASQYVFTSGVLMLVAFFFDFFDGKVARLLGQMNKFGGEFDNVADLISYSVAPSFILYTAYRTPMIDLPGARGVMVPLPWGGQWELQGIIAVLVSMIPALFGCIRFARFNVRKLDLSGYWVGFPRPASALLIVALVNSHLFNISPVMGWVGVALVVVVAFAGLTLVPYIGHHGRKWSWYLAIVLNFVWASVAFSAVFSLIIPVLPPRVTFDWVVIWLSFYLFYQWLDIPLATRKAVARLTKDWND